MGTGILRIGFILLTVVLTFARCGSSKPAASSASIAEALVSEGKYAGALTIYRKIVSDGDRSGASVDASVLKRAAQAATHQKDHSFVLDCIERLAAAQTLTIEDAQLYVDNVAFVDDDNRQLAFFANHHNLLINTLGNEKFHTTLCRLYGRIGNTEGVVDNWPQANDATKLEWFSVYYKGVKDQKNADELIMICNQMLSLDSNLKDALNYKAVLLFDKNEARYKKLMDDYNKNKNATTYAYLKRDLKALSSDYRECRELFEKLRQ